MTNYHENCPVDVTYSMTNTVERCVCDCHKEEKNEAKSKNPKA
jgi:hypothetical protein